MAIWSKRGVCIKDLDKLTMFWWSDFRPIASAASKILLTSKLVKSEPKVIILFPLLMQNLNPRYKRSSLNYKEACTFLSSNLNFLFIFLTMKKRKRKNTIARSFLTLWKSNFFALQNWIAEFIFFITNVNHILKDINNLFLCSLA